LTLRYPSSSLSFAPAGRATHPPGDPYAPEPTHLASLHSIISLYALHPSPDPSLGTGGRLPAIPSFIHAPAKNSAGQVIDRSTENMSACATRDQLPSLITLHHSMGLLPIPTNFAEQLLTNTNLLLAKNIGIANPAMRITNVGIGEIDYYSSIVAHSFTQAGTHEAGPPVMRIMRSFWSGLKMVWGFVGLGEEAGEWKVVEKKLLWIVKRKRSGEYSVGRSSEWLRRGSYCLATDYCRNSMAALLLDIPFPTDDRLPNAQIHRSGRIASPNPTDLQQLIRLNLDRQLHNIHRTRSETPTCAGSDIHPVHELFPRLGIGIRWRRGRFERV
jgi:hypothetical protein